MGLLSVLFVFCALVAVGRFVRSWATREMECWTRRDDARFWREVEANRIRLFDQDSFLRIRDWDE